MTTQKSNECPKVIANALFQVQTQIGTLGYDSSNDFSKYKYVSILRENASTNERCRDFDHS